MADILDGGADEHAETGGIANRIDDLGFLRGLRPFLLGLSRLDDQAGRVVGALRARRVGDARGLEGTRIPGGDGLPSYNRDSVMLRALYWALTYQTTWLKTYSDTGTTTSYWR